jgi:hypothetical protein
MSMRRSHLICGLAAIVAFMLLVPAGNGAGEPPVLGALGSHAAGRPLKVRCAKQNVAVKEQPRGTLLVDVRLCNVLIGYLVANPWAPKAGTAPARQVSLAALSFLRGVARTAGVPPAKTDCRVLGEFSGFMHGLGAVASQAVALRADLLTHRAVIKPPLSLGGGCSFH